MRVAIVNAPFPEYSQGYEPPIHLAYLGAYLKREGHEVDIVDAGLRKEAAQVIRDIDDADFVAIHVDIHNIGAADEIARLLKQRQGNVPAAVWGNLPSAIPARVLKENPSLDIAIKREPELTLTELLAKAREGGGFFDVLGCAVRTPQGIIENENRSLIDDLDSLPDADRDLLTKKNTYPPFLGPPEGYLLTSRGCPYNCNFCSANLYGKFRRRSPERVVDEIERVVNSYDVKDFVIRDYTLAPRSHVVSLCDEIIKRDLRIAWHCLIRVDMIEEELLQHMKRAGCYEVNFGIESADQEILERYHKGTALDQVYRTFELCKKTGIETMANIMIGSPYDTPESVRKTIDFFCELDPDRACITLFFPYPGTPIFDHCRESGILKTEDWSKYYTDPWLDHEYDRILDLSPEVIKELKRGYKRLLARYLRMHMRKALNPLHLLRIRPLHFRQLAQYIRWW